MTTVHLSIRTATNWKEEGMLLCDYKRAMM